MITEIEKIDEILDRGTIVEILPTKDQFRQTLMSGKKLRFYIGFDATAPTLHLSHAKNLMLLEKFRKLGHEVIVLFGDFTARIGDPTGESTTRKQLTREDVMTNVEKWKTLIKPLMDFNDSHNPPLIRYNHDWLSKIDLEGFLKLGTNFTVQQMLERDMFQKRISDEKPIYLHEFMYPLMQGFDSVAMDVDVEICGTDQTFNALTGRILQKRLNNKEKFVVAVTLMENPKTGELMSKSKGTGVFLDTTPSDMYGQIMSQPDEMIDILFVNNTLLSKQEIEEIKKMENPRDIKMRLAYEIVKTFSGDKEAMMAQDNFVSRFQKKVATDIEEFLLPAGAMSIVDVLITVGFVTSKGEARRLIEQGGIRLNGEVIKDNIMLDISAEGAVLERGKLKIVKIVANK
jgi:tyrosyl-tRNA synthetase